jgi:hypothetical protein
MMRVLKGESQGSDETPALTTSRRRRTIPHKVKGKKPAAGVVHPTACVTLRSSSGASYESFSSHFFYVLPPLFDEVVDYDAKQRERRGTRFCIPTGFCRNPGTELGFWHFEKPERVPSLTGTSTYLCTK